MTVHKRIRRFNTRDTYPEQKLDNDLCQAVVAEGTMVFVRGQVGQDLDSSESVAIGDAVGQAEKAMANIEVLLKEAGSQLEHVCKITIYIVDPRYREGVYRVVGKWLKGVFPVSTGIVVSGLPAQSGWSKSTPLRSFRIKAYDLLHRCAMRPPAEGLVEMRFLGARSVENLGALH